jgi:hypothetical protein
MRAASSWTTIWGGGGQAPTVGPLSDIIPAGDYAIRIQYEEAFGGNQFVLMCRSEPDESVRGDMNSDGAINTFDISGFTLALLDPQGYTAQTGNDPVIGDINGDGTLNTFDIGPFVAILTGNQPAPQLRLLEQLEVLKLPDADNDGDGTVNSNELLAGTDANNAADCFRITGVSRTSDGMAITWHSVPGRRYAIDYSSTAEPGSWKIVEWKGAMNIEATGWTTRFVDSAPRTASGTKQVRFYRVKVIPDPRRSGLSRCLRSSRWRALQPSARF